MAKNYKLDFATMTITFTKKFLARVGDGDGEARAEYARLLKDFSRMTIAGKPKQHRTNKTQMSYAKFEKYIACLQDADVYMKMFEDVKKVSLSQRSPYNYVRNWFFETFPNYLETPEMDTDGRVIVDKVKPLPELRVV